MDQPRDNSIEHFQKKAAALLQRDIDPALTRSVFVRAMERATPHITIATEEPVKDWRQKLCEIFTQKKILSDAVVFPIDPADEDLLSAAASIDARVHLPFVPLQKTASFDHVKNWSTLTAIAAYFLSRRLNDDWSTLKDAVMQLSKKNSDTSAVVFPSGQAKLQADQYLLEHYLYGKVRPLPQADVQYDQLRKKWNVLTRLLRMSSHARESLLQAMKQVPLLRDRLLASAAVHAGCDHLLDATEVSDYEWWSYLQKRYEPIKKNPVSTPQSSAVAESSSDPLTSNEQNLQLIIDELQPAIEDAMRERPCDYNTEACAMDQKEREEILKNARAHLEVLAPHSPIFYLRDTIGYAYYLNMLAKARAEHNPALVDALEREIAARVFGSVMRYLHASDQGSPKEQAARCLDYSFPTNIVADKKMTCFSGPWLMGMLLMECGIRRSQLFLRHENENWFNSQFGSHSSLIVGTENRRLLCLDFGTHEIIDFTLHPYDIPTNRRLGKLFDGLTAQPVRVNADPLSAARSGMPRDAVILPFMDGVTSLYLMHIGIDFLRDHQWKEAAHALDVALTFNPMDPDLWYHRGLALKQLAQFDQARMCFEKAVSLYNGHLLAHMALGQAAENEKDIEGALRHYRIVAEDKRAIWGSETFRINAEIRIFIHNLIAANQSASGNEVRGNAGDIDNNL